ncbi:putative sigma-54 modulation protein [Seinonella peptonophila]|uniref:Ribosome hibernation promoting factor n=1 Tax=Seinonella peptonophila TaxID=112248 RepID=A0A1M4XQW4_9BACL|nr:putative sigma-54 modulation protein [Seinonella peptonophila]
MAGIRVNLVIRGNHISITSALGNFVRSKLSRLDKFLDMNPTGDANVVLSVLKNDHKVEVTIPYPGLVFRAEESSKDMYASIDLVVEKLERQIRKYKTKVTRKLRYDDNLRQQMIENSLGQETNEVKSQSETTETAERFPIVRSKRFHLKPMDAQEAILQMNALGHDFFVFTQAETNQVNVIYRRKDGQYGLIEPE